MKPKFKLSKQILLLFLFYSILKVSFSQQTVVTYEPLIPPVFPNQGTPINLGILDFNSFGVDSNYSEKFYSALKSDTSLIRKFQIYPFRTLQQLKKTFSIENFSPSDLDMQKKLYENLGITYLISGEINEKELIISIRSTISGQIVFSNSYKDSESSTALKDAMKLFSSGLTTKYKSRGMLNIIVHPEDAAFTINMIPQENKSNIILNPGKYIIEFTKEGYYPLKESIEIGEGKKLNKEYTMCRSFGGVKIEVFPKDVKTKIICEQDTTNTLELTGDIYLNNLQSGMYRFIFSRVSYVTDNRRFRIRPDEILNEKISLTNTLFGVVEDISSNNFRAYGLKIESGEDFYKIYYNLAGKPGETFDINLYIASRDDPNKLMKQLVFLKGDWGPKIKPGRNKTIIWDAKKEFPQGFGSIDYTIYLEVD
jgi:hypothetical protein